MTIQWTPREALGIVEHNKCTRLTLDLPFGPVYVDRHSEECFWREGNEEQWHLTWPAMKLSNWLHAASEEEAKREAASVVALFLWPIVGQLRAMAGQASLRDSLVNLLKHIERGDIRVADAGAEGTANAFLAGWEVAFRGR